MFVRIAEPRGRAAAGHSSGFTLIELLVVVVILGILVGIVVRNVQSRVPQARVAVVKTQMREFESALDEYKMDNGQYPSSEQGLQALATKPNSGQIPTNYPDGGYMKRIPKDPWGNDYLYIYRPTAQNSIEVISLGSDGKEGGEGEEKDLVNHEVLGN